MKKLIALDKPTCFFIPLHRFIQGNGREHWWQI